MFTKLGYNDCIKNLWLLAFEIYIFIYFSTDTPKICIFVWVYYLYNWYKVLEVMIFLFAREWQRELGLRTTPDLMVHNSLF